MTDLQQRIQRLEKALGEINMDYGGYGHTSEEMRNIARKALEESK